MKKLSIILIFALAVFSACTKSKEVHPELGDGNEEFLTVGTATAHVEYTRADMAELQKVVFHYGLSGVRQFTATEMTKQESFFELNLNGLLSDTVYCYYYELYPNGGDASVTEQKTIHTLALDEPTPPTPTPSVAELPTVVTAEVTEITTNSAVCGGEVTNDGGAEVTERGLCWGINENPTLDDIHIAVGNGIGSFSRTISGLEANTVYHVRAYATNERGTAYGLDKEFTTLVYVPEGAINGLFTINADGDQMYFSQGNLQYQASTNTWRFAEHQWDYVGSQNPWLGNPGGTVDGSDNNLISSTYDGWIDFFGWGTSGWNSSAVCYQPWSTSKGYSDYYPGGSYTNNLTGSYANADWGVYNAISNGGNTANTWRTLTSDEWVYVFNTRTTSSGIRYAKANVHNVNGVILLPDDWKTSYYSLDSTNNVDVDFDSNFITASQWATLEQHGAVFLPAAGRREGSSVYAVGSFGLYWSASYSDSSNAYTVNFNEYNLNPQYYYGRGDGQSVRLVRSAQ